MPIFWEWLPNRSLDKQIEVRHDGMTSGGEHGAVHILDKKKTVITANFQGRGFTEAEADDLFADADVPGATMSPTDHLGTEWTGTVQSLSEDVVDDGGTIYKVLKLTLINATKT